MMLTASDLPAPRGHRSEWWLLGIVAMLLGLVLVYLHRTETRRALAHESDRLRVQADVISSELGRNLASTNQALRGVIRDHLRGGVSANRPEDVAIRLRALQEAIAGVRFLGVYDRHGVMLASTRPDLLGQDFSHRDYFTTARDKPDAGTLYVSTPFKSVRNDLVVTVARMVPGADGEFSGVIVATLDPEYFNALLRPIVYASDVRAVVVHGDGVQLMNFPPAAGTDGTQLQRPGAFFQRHLDTGQVSSLLAGAIDTVESGKMMALHTVQPPPLGMDKALVVGVSRELAAITQPAQRQALVFGLFYALLVLLSCGVLYGSQTRRKRMDAVTADRDRARLDAGERVQQALRGANLGLWEVHVPTGEGTIDESSCAMLGYTLAELAPEAGQWRRFMHADDRPAFEAASAACIDGSIPFYELSYRMRHRDGHWVWILSRAKAMERDAAGRAVRILGTHMDISQAKNFESEVVRTRNELLTVFDNLSEAVLVFDNQQRLVRVNRAGKTVHGLFDADMPAEQTRARMEVLLPNGDPLPGDQWPSARAMRGDFVRDYEVQLRRKDTGYSVHVESNTAPIMGETGQTELVLHTYRDVSERRMAIALRESEARFRTLIEDAPLAIAILRGGRIIYANPRYHVLHGYAPGVGLAGLAWSGLFTAESHAALKERHDLIAADSPSEQSFEAVGLGKAGAAVPVLNTTARVELADGPATMVFAQDISNQKLAETALLNARDAAEGANRSKADFLSNMSHEIRSPLNAILGLAYLLEKAHLNRDSHDMVQKIRASGRSLLGIINDILDVSKIEAGRMELEHAPFRLSDLIDRVASTMGLAAGDKNIELVIDPLPAGMTNFMGDVLRLEQVLNNLASNAVKFTGVGQVALRMRVLARDGMRVTLRFSVQDTGIGIAPEMQKEVFTPFSQADSSTTRRFGGTGLGLTICSQLVALMGGAIGLVSAPGEGSEFWFTVMLQQVPGGDVSSPEMLHVHVLVVDDSDIARDAVAATARDLGWGVEALDSGEAALATVLERVDGQLPDVIVLDWKMPGMDGLMTARAIRRSVPAQACPIVIMATAYSLSVLSVEEGVGLVDAVLSKPVTTSALYNAVIAARRQRAETMHPQPVLLEPATRELSDVRLLVVDDSPINCEVAKRIFEEHGAAVMLASGGEAALEWLLAHPGQVDVVLMDVQMPGMDGLEVTRRLRRLPHFRDLPVVALSAGAFKMQQDEARAAGMTDFIGKPFDVPFTVALVQRLARQRPGHGAGGAGGAGGADVPAPGSEPSARNPALPERLVMDAGAGLRTWGDLGTYRRYLRLFEATYAQAAASIAVSLSAGDRAAALALVHKLAGVAGNMALPECWRMAAELERCLAEERDATGVLAQLDTALLDACAAIRRLAPDAADVP